MFVSMSVLVLLVVMCLVAGFFIWRLILRTFADGRAGDARLEGNSLIR